MKSVSLLLYLFILYSSFAYPNCARQIGAVAVGIRLDADERFILTDGKVYQVLREIEAGADRRVYQVLREEDGPSFVYKHARSPEIPEGKSGMEKERNTVADLFSMGVRHPDIVLFGEDWLLRDWVDGLLGTYWFKDWKRQGYPASDIYWQKFLQLVTDTANQGVVIGAMDLDDIMIANGEWVVIDSGRVRRMSREEAWEYYEDDLIYSWSHKIAEPEVGPILKQRLREATVKR